jgi:uncharacterized delta-60 repeat protein
MRRAAIEAAVATSLAWAVLVPALAQATEGDLDTSFGSGGKLTTPIGTGMNEARSVSLDPQGRIVVAGYALIAASYDFALARYNPNGVLDTSFNGTGEVTTPIGAADQVNAVAIDSQGRIVAAGVSNNGSNDDFAVTRYTPNGAPDTNFNTSGKVTTPIGSGADAANAVAIDSQDRVVAAGSSFNGANDDFAVARYNENGTPDSSFNGTGNVTTPIGSSADRGAAVAIDSQGRIVVAGSSNNGANNDFALVRYNAGGTLDTSFGGTGKVTTPIGSAADAANAVAIDSQGRIVVAGLSVIAGNAQFAVARYNADGTLDTSFGSGGTVTTAIGTSAFASSVVIDQQGRIVAAGGGLTGSKQNFAIARYTTSGTLDPSLGVTGHVTTPFGSGADFAKGLAIDSQGRLVAVGSTFNGADFDFALARYIGDQTPPNVTIASGPAESAYTNDSTPTFTFTSTSPDAAAFSCGLDGLSAGCASPFTSPALTDGKHTFGLTGTDKAGNTSAATTRHFTVDTRKPKLKIKGKAKVRTKGRKARDKLKLKPNEPSTFTCKVDRKKAKRCKAKYKTPKLKLGKHRVKVTATDRAGNRVSKTKRLKVVAA